MAWLLVFLGGGVGSLCRYGLTLVLPVADLSKGDFPWATFSANLLACLVLGAGIALFSRELITKELSLLLVTGFCGGFSTFSTFSGELVGFYEGGYLGAALAYAIGSTLAGVAAIFMVLYLLR